MTDPQPNFISPTMELHISEDDMEATLRIRGSYDPSINYDAVIELLNDYKVIYGQDVNAIKKILGDFQSGTGRVFEGVVARGRSPLPGKDGAVEFLVPEPPPVTFDADGRADYRNIEKYRTVEQGQVLARRIPSEPGMPGISILGEEVKPPEPQEPVLEAGQNVSLVPSSNEYVARIRGIYVKSKERLEISPVLAIPGNVGLETGNVNYDGNVEIGGNIERGSVVSISGDLTVEGIVESGEIRVGGTLTARKGINTRKEGMVNVNGDIRATYIENSGLTVDGSIRVERSIIQCKIIGYGDISLKGGGSTITGGEIVAFGSVAADVFGNKNELPTRIILGLHYKNMQYYKVSQKELEKVERDFQRRVNEVEKIKVYVQRMRNRIGPDKKAEFRVIFNEYKKAQALKQRVEEQIREFYGGRYNKDEVRVIARELIHPGVEFHYRGMVEKIRAPLTRVILRFIPGEEKPVMEAYKEASDL